MKKRSLCTGAAAALCLSAGTGAAQEANLVDSLAHELVEVMIPRSQMNQMLDGFLMISKQMFAEQMSGVLDEEEYGAEVAACLRRYQEDLMQDMRTFLIEDMDVVSLSRSVYEGIYAKHFSEQELRDLLTFYRSATGQRFVEKQSEVALEAIQAINLKMLPAMMERMEADKDDLLTRLQECPGQD